MIAIFACASLIAGVGCSKDRRSGATFAPGVVVAIEDTPEVRLRAGDSGEAVIVVAVADGYHVQSNPASNEFYIPLELNLEPQGPLGVGKPVYPGGDPHFLEGSPHPLLTYEGRIAIRLPLHASTGASPGRYRLEGTVRYQACDSQRCLYPATVPITLSVRVVD